MDFLERVNLLDLGNLEQQTSYAISFVPIAPGKVRCLLPGEARAMLAVAWHERWLA